MIIQSLILKNDDLFEIKSWLIIASVTTSASLASELLYFDIIDIIELPSVLSMILL